MATTSVATHTDAGSSAAGYDGFMSYSHAADGLLAPRLQTGLQGFAKPWWKRRALRIFRDESSLAANPHLWSSITEALDNSAWFVLLLSPDAAESEWVNQEIEYWRRHKELSRILPVLTDGTFEWAGGDVSGSAVPEQLQGAFSEEPRWVDMRFAKEEEQLDLKNPRFSNAVADIASAMRGVPKDELESEEVRQHRRTIRTAWTAALVVLLLGIVAGLAAIRASQNAEEARRLAEAEAAARSAEAEARAEAEANETWAKAEGLAAASIEQVDDDPERSVLLALESLELAETPNGLTALHRALQSHRTVWRGSDLSSSTFLLHPDGEHFVTMSGTGQVNYWSTEGDTSKSLWTTNITAGDSVRGSRPWIDEEENVVILPVTDLGDPRSGLTDSVTGEHRGLFTLDLDDGQVIDVTPIDGCVYSVFFQPPAYGSTGGPALAVLETGVSAEDSAICDPPPSKKVVVRPDAMSEESVTLDLPPEAFRPFGSWWDLSTDGNFFTMSNEAGAWLVDAHTGEVVETYRNTSRVTPARDSKGIFLYKRRRVEHVDISSGDLQLTIPGDFEWIRFTPDMDLLVGIDATDSAVKVFEANSGALIRELDGPEGTRARTMRLDAGSERVLVWYDSGEVLLFEIGSTRSEVHSPISRVIESSQSVDRGTMTLGGGLLFVSGFIGDERSYTVQDETGTLLRDASAHGAFMSEGGSVILEMPVVETGPNVPSGYFALIGRQRLVDARSGELIQELPSTCSFFFSFVDFPKPGPDCDEGEVFLDLTDVSFSDDGTVVAVESTLGKPTAFDLAANELVFHEDTDLSRVEEWPSQTVALSPDGSMMVYEVLAPGGSEHVLGFKVVDVRTGDTLTHEGTCGLSKVEYNDDGSRLYVADFCSDVVVFETGNWTEVARFGRGQGQTIADLALSGDNLATVGTDDVVRVWNVVSGDLLMEVQLQTTPRNVEFLNDWHILVTTPEGEVLVFTLDPKELKEIAIGRLTRGLTDEECAIYAIDPCLNLDMIKSR